MFKTKVEVDRHVEQSLRRITNETERNLRCFAFAKLYYNIGEYQQAYRYITSYLSVKPKSPEGHTLLGTVLEKLGKLEAALESYKTSFQQDTRQKALVLKICKLLETDTLSQIDQSTVKYFCDLAQQIDPHNPTILTLKERLISKKSSNPNSEITQLLLTELEHNPKDINVRTRLIKHLLQNGSVEDAYKHASEVEWMLTQQSNYNFAWYQTLSEVMLRYKPTERDPMEYWILSISSLERLVAVSLDEHIDMSDDHRKLSDYHNTALFNFDQALTQANESLSTLTTDDRMLLTTFTTHFRAQLYLHVATALYKQAKREMGSLKEVANLVLPVFLVAYHSAPLDLMDGGMWFNGLTEKRRGLVMRWCRDGAYRCSQAGHILMSTLKDRSKSAILEKSKQFSTGNWREYIFKKLFVTRDLQYKMNSSYFTTNLTEIIYQLPDISDLRKYDESAQHVHGESLHHYVWIAMNYADLSVFNLKTFDGLKYSIKNLQNCGAETLNVLDILSFIYATTLSVRYRGNSPSTLLPAAICERLATQNQANFMHAAMKVYRNEEQQSTNNSELRMLIIKAIEIMRCMSSNNALHVRLLVDLARMFGERATRANVKQSEVDANNARAELYWKSAMPMLERITNNLAPKQFITTTQRFFDVPSSVIITPNEAKSYVEQAKLFTGVQLLKQKDYDNASAVFETLNDPFASFYLAQIFKTLAEQKVTHANQGSVTSEMRSQHVILLSKARDWLYVTLDRLRDPSFSGGNDHPLNASLGNEIEKIERLLSRIEPDDRNVCDGMSDASYSSNEQHETAYTSALFSLNMSKIEHATTPKKSAAIVKRSEARPSPERLDAQIRQLISTKDAAISNIMEQNRLLSENNRTIIDELRQNKESIGDISKAVTKNTDSFTSIVNDLKNSLDDIKSTMQDFKASVSDSIIEIRREISDIKSGKTKFNQLSDEDLYVLDQESLGFVTPPPTQHVSASSATSLPRGLPLQISPYTNAATAAAMLAAAAYGIPPHPAAAYYQSAANEHAAAAAAAAMLPALYPPHAPPSWAANLGSPHSMAVPPPQTQHLTGAPQQLPAAHLSGYNMIQQHALGPLSNLPGYGANMAGNISNMVSSAPTSVAFSNAFMSNLTGHVPTMAASSASAISGNISTGNQYYQQQQNVVPPNVSLPNMAFNPPNLIENMSNLSSNQTAAAASLPNVTKNVPKTATQSHIVGSIQQPVAQMPTSKPLITAAPVNVVITSSDPLPSLINNRTSVSQPILSVTIPPQHIRGAVPKPTTTVTTSIAPPVHNYQIAMPANAISPSVGVSGKNVALGLQIEKDLNDTFNTSDNKNVSTSSVEEFEANVNFKPVVPLPDEVPVNTGEENEKELFCQRAKLYRHVTENNIKEWKERGVGTLKILYNPSTQKTRILMRRDQIHKICANHFITTEMSMTPMTNNDRAYVWAAHDFADETVAVEKFCVRFKTAEDAKQFSDAFKRAQEMMNTEIKDKFEALPKSTPTSQSFGGFTFSGTPNFSTKTDVLTTPTPVSVGTTKTLPTSPFASFSFTSTPTTTVATTAAPDINDKNKNVSRTTVDDGDVVDDFVPTVEFQPVVELPELVEVKTGEENCEVLFGERAKLFRYDISGETKEWKEKGIGPIKILKDDLTVRLLMRRDQVHKVCCNHQILKNMLFKPHPSNTKAVQWHAQDFSEGVLKPETFTVRFKTDDNAANFLRILHHWQNCLDENNQISTSKHHKAEPVATKPELSKHKLSPTNAKGSWTCKNCYVINEPKTEACAACETAKTGTSGTGKSGATFSFGVRTSTPGSVTIKPPVLNQNQQNTRSSSWGDAFKPAEGSWECQTCFVRNNGDKDKCLSCETSRHGENKTDETKSIASGIASNLKGVNLDTGGLKFSFGVPASLPSVTNPISTSGTSDDVLDLSGTKTSDKGFGDKFKLKEGTWECKDCYVRNEPISTRCLSCGTAKICGTVTPTIASTETVKAPAPTFSFGSGSLKPSEPNSGFNFAPSEKGDTTSNTDRFVFGSPQKHDFEFKPRSPNRRISSGQGEESDSYGEEEEDNMSYFKAVVPLPDIVDVFTGEEDEELLYCHRAKLFRLSGGEWKERGVGNIKILQRNDGTVRVVMRRDQVLKVCLNHFLNNDIKYMEKDKKTLLFHAPDYSEGDLSYEMFCLRFQNADLANEFRDAANKALGNYDDTDPIIQKHSAPHATEEHDDDDIVWISETIVSKEEEEEAVKLGLPPKFMSYRQLPDCTCEQCKKDDEYLRELFTPSASKKSDSLRDLLLKPSSTIFGTTASNLFGQNKTVFGNSSPSTIFGQKPSETTFGTVTSTTSASSHIGQKSTESSIFASPTVTDTPIFGNSVFGTTSSKPNFALFNTSTVGSTKSTDSASSIFSISNTIFKPVSEGTQSTPITTPTATDVSAKFGTLLKSTTTSNIFGNTQNLAPTTTTSSTPNIIDTSPSVFSKTTPNIFSSAANSQGLFGQVSTSATITGSLFSSPVSSSGFSSGTTNIFGAKSSLLTVDSTKSITTPPSTVFGGNIFGKKTETQVKDAQLSFGSTVTGIVGTTESLKEDDELVLNCDTGLSFASLAAGTASDVQPAFPKKGGETAAATFSFLGAGAPVFRGATGNTANKTSGDVNKNAENVSDNEDGGGAGDGAHDPHFEPIVPLPDEVVVTTGEEDETVLFNGRAKLYRFDSDTKEWKERGVGQIKLLYHPANATYRLLLRREQVHKLVLNQRITSDLNIQPMATSDKAWMWAAYNYTDDQNNLEKLAVRFKSVELAVSFKDAITDAIKKVEELQTHNVTLAVGDGTGDSANEHEDCDNDDEDQEEDDYLDDEDDDDGKTLMFTKRCTLSEQLLPDEKWTTVAMGDLQVFYDPDFYAAKIMVTDDDGAVRSKTLIGMNTVMNIDKNECIWRAVEWAMLDNIKFRNLKATFSSASAAQEFHSNYLEGINYAEQVGMMDELPTGDYEDHPDDDVDSE